MTSFLVGTSGIYLVCEDKPEIKSNGNWQVDGMQVEVPHYIASFIAQACKQKLEDDCIIDLTDTSFLF